MSLAGREDQNTWTGRTRHGGPMTIKNRLIEIKLTTRSE